MNEHYLCLLSDETKALLDRIEESIESEIIVKIDSERNNTLACEIENFEPTILTPSMERFLDDSVLHELLHFKRFCIDKIPRMIACDNYNFTDFTFENKITTLDNNLEHFVIVPEEIQMRPARQMYWESKIEQKLDYLQGFDALVMWAFAKHAIPNTDVCEKIDHAVHNINLRNDAEKLYEDILENLESKEKLVKSCVSRLDIPSGAICLEYLDFKLMHASELCLESIEKA